MANTSPGTGGSVPPGTKMPGVDTVVPTLPGYGEVIWEHPHNPLARSLPLIRGKLSRGYIVQDKSDPAVKKNKHGRPLGLHFLYNPTEVDVTYAMNTDIFPSSTAPGGDIPLMGVPGGSQISWNLILDRTWDVNADQHSRGIMYDVEQFEQMVAYAPDQPFIQPVSMFVVFGNRLMTYYGYVSGFTVVYTNWTQDMRPYRGALSGLTFQVMPLSKGTKKGKKSKSGNFNYVTNVGNAIAAAGGPSAVGATSGDPTTSGNGRSQPSPTPAPSPTP